MTIKMKQEHSPAPWTWQNDWPVIDRIGAVYFDEDADEGDRIEKYMDLQLMGSDGKPIIPIRIDHHAMIYDGDPITPADRALIAAAPDLLAACQSFLDAPNHAHGHAAGLAEAERRIRAAILLATGEP